VDYLGDHPVRNEVLCLAVDLVVVEVSPDVPAHILNEYGAFVLCPQVLDRERPAVSARLAVLHLGLEFVSPLQGFKVEML
jgi:hypothetical protein